MFIFTSGPKEGHERFVFVFISVWLFFYTLIRPALKRATNRFVFMFICLVILLYFDYGFMFFDTASGPKEGHWLFGASGT